MEMKMEYNENPIEDALTQEAEAEKAKSEEEKKERERLTSIDRWHKRVEFGRNHDSHFRDRWADDRRMARGETEWLVDTNLIGSIMEVLSSFLYAKDPDIMSRPSKSVNRKLIKEYRAVAQTLEIMVSRLLKDARLKRNAKKWVLGSMTVGVGWMKAAMQTRKEPNTLVLEQLNDLMQQKHRIDALMAKHEGAEQSGEDYDSDMADIDANILALQSQRELMIAEGMVLDVFAPEDVIVAPDCGEIENYLAAPWIAFDMYKTVDEAYEITGWNQDEDKENLKSANIYMQRPRDGSDKNKGGSSSKGAKWERMNEKDETEDGFIRFTEIWSKRDGVVHTLIDGIHDRWARECYAPITGKRWYPLFYLPCHEIDGERFPQSDVFQLKRLQDEYGRTRSNYAEHRRRAVPGIVFDEGAVSPESIKKLVAAQVQEYLGIDLIEPGRDMRTIFAPKLYNQIDMALYDTSVITAEMEKVSGAQDALQSSVQIEKTATEAKIQEAGFGARSGARRDTLEDALTELSEYTAQLVLQLMDQADAMTFAGPDAAWVVMTTEEALMNFNIEVKAGSTGKPKANNDREIWGTLLPLMEKLIDRIGQARVVGAEWAAKPWIALLEETMQRLDDPAEIEKFLPVPPEPQPEKPAEPTETEKAQIESDKSQALKARSDVIVNIPQMFTEQQAQNFLLFGGQYQPPPQPPQAAQLPAPEAPNPLNQ
jgi:hypothetical protein